MYINDALFQVNMTCPPEKKHQNYYWYTLREKNVICHNMLKAQQTIAKGDNNDTKQQ